MIFSFPTVFLFILAIVPIEAQGFRCDELLRSASAAVTGQETTRTFEYVNPKTNLRGVACVSLLNNGETMIFYIEEETALTNVECANFNSMVRAKHKQAMGRAQLKKQSIDNSNVNSTNFFIFTGLLHIINNTEGSQKQGDLFDHENSQFSLSYTSPKGLATLTVKPFDITENNLIYLWHPRDSVPNWEMQVNIPKFCGIKFFTLHDPIGDRPKSDRAGKVCVLEHTNSSLKFFSIGWKKSGASGRARKFINFGVLRSASPSFFNIYTGRVHVMAFPGHMDLPASEVDRLEFKEALKVTTVQAINTKDFMVYGDLQEEWLAPRINIQNNVDDYPVPRYPLLPSDLSLDYSDEIRQIYGINIF